MATTNSEAQANGWLKSVYGKAIEVMPDGVKLIRRIKFNKNEDIGKDFTEVAFLGAEQGFTYNTGTANPGYSLANPIAAVSQQVTLAGSEIQLRSWVDTKLMWQAYGAGQKSFGDYGTRLMGNMTYSFKKRLEVSCLYGGRSIGASTTGGISGTVTTRAIVINLADWAPGIWAGSKNMELDYSTDAATVANTNAAIVVVSVNASTRTVNVSGNATDLTALDAAIATAKFYYRGSLVKEMKGLFEIASNTTGVYANVNASTYDMWQGNPITVNGDLTWDKIQDGIEAAVGRGLEDDLVLMVPTPAWSNLNSDVNALRKIDASYSVEKNELGQKSIVYYSMNGKVTVEPSIYVKYGDAVAYPEDSSYHMRIGSTEQTFDLPGSGKMFTLVPNTSAAEFRAFSDQALYVRAPNKCIAFSSVVSS